MSTLTQKYFDFIKKLLEKNPQKYKELKDDIKGKSNNTLISLGTLNNIDIGTMKRILRKIERDKFEKKIDYVLKQLDNINLKF